MQCRICGGVAENHTYDVREMMCGTREKFRYFQCQACGCLQIAQIPPDLSRHYPDQYYSYAPIRSPAGLKRWMMTARDSRYVFRKGLAGAVLAKAFPTPLFRWTAPLTLRRDMRILDVGCGVAKIMFSLAELGFTHLLGVDPFLPEDIVYPNGLAVRRQRIEDVPGEWDLVTMHHSLEHIPDQQATLRQVHRLLAPSGVCVVRIPIVAWAWEHYGTDWVQLDAPRHLYLHSVDSMRRLAADAGCVVSDILYDSKDFQIWGSEQYRRDIPLQDGRSHAVSTQGSIFSKRELKTAACKAEELNAAGRGDQAAFYLKKA